MEDECPGRLTGESVLLMPGERSGYIEADT